MENQLVQRPVRRLAARCTETWVSTTNLRRALIVHMLTIFVLQLLILVVSCQTIYLEENAIT